MSSLHHNSTAPNEILVGFGTRMGHAEENSAAMKQDMTVVDSRYDWLYDSLAE